MKHGRRQFIKGLSLFSALAAGATVAQAQSATAALGGPNVSDSNNNAIGEAVDPNVIAQLEEQHTSSLALTQTYGEIAPPPPPPTLISTDGSMCFSGSSNWVTSALVINQSGNVCINGSNKNFVPGTEKRVDVKMAPGPDGELYLNVNGQWKKVVTV